MLFSLNINSIRDVLKRRGSRAIALQDIPMYVQEQTGLHAMTMSTDLLAGAKRDTLTRIRENGDRVGCACLLLSETDPLSLGDPRQKIGEDAVIRMTKVVEAASLLGCNSASLEINAKDTDEAMELVATRIRRVLERADRLEIMVLIRPSKGLTQDAERLTELVKAIGGFRIGTMPDFESAVASGDPVQYLKKLTPYASVVNASTLAFKDPEPVAVEPGGKAEAESPEPETADEPADKTASDTPSEPGESGTEAGEIAGMTPEEAILAAIEAELDALDEVEAPEHVGYDLTPLIGAIRAVGFDGTVAIDYRGKDDGTVGVLQSKDALEAALEMSAD
ncbi:MAG: TIM barrel protein [Phycisphaerales bacterium]